MPLTPQAIVVILRRTQTQLRSEELVVPQELETANDVPKSIIKKLQQLGGLNIVRAKSNELLPVSRR